jgi:hypothetical protein
MESLFYYYGDMVATCRHGGDVEKNRRLAEPDGNWAGNDRKWAINGLKFKKGTEWS